MASDGWVVDPRPASPELAEDYEPHRFEREEIPFEHDHIRDWAGFGELLGPDGVKALMKAVQ